MPHSGIPLLRGLHRREVGRRIVIRDPFAYDRNSEELHLSGSGQYYASVRFSSETSVPSRSRKRILVARWVSGMNLVEVYVVRAEAPEAVLASLHYVFTREAYVVRALSHGKADFGSKDNVVADTIERPAGDLFGDTIRVDVGGI